MLSRPPGRALATAVVLLVCSFLCSPGRAQADPGLAADPAPTPAPLPAIEVMRPLGDTYNEYTHAGESYPESLAIRAYAAFGKYALWYDFRRNFYHTEDAGNGSLTHYPRIEGGYGSVPPFFARDSYAEIRAERELGIPRLYAGIGYDHTYVNYHYPELRGLGPGFEYRASDAPGARPFGSIFYYPSMTGNYITETLPHRNFSPPFRDLKIDYGVRIQFHSPVYFIADYGNEYRRARGIGAQIRYIRSDPAVGFGTRL
jgi:hypothetical protein